MECSVKECKNPVLAKGYCSKHWNQQYRRGEIPLKTRRSPNDFIIKDHDVEIILRDNLGNEKSRTLIDIEDLCKAEKHKWYQNNSGYAISRVSKNRQIFLHRLILKPDKNYYVDHIDGNPLNNKRDNLRICTHQQNMINRKIGVDNKSGIKGVDWDSKRNKWRARIQVKKKSKHLGYFSSKEEAKKARINAELIYYGEYRRETKL